MSVETYYAEIGKFIYGAFRRGGDLSDVYQWMAADLGIAPPKDDGNTVPEELYAAFFVKHATADAFDQSFQQFLEMLERRKPNSVLHGPAGL